MLNKKCYTLKRSCKISYKLGNIKTRASSRVEPQYGNTVYKQTPLYVLCKTFRCFKNILFYKIRLSTKITKICWKLDTGSSEYLKLLIVYNNCWLLSKLQWMTCYHHFRYVTGLNLQFFKFQRTSETLKLEKHFHLWKLFFLKIKDVDGLMP